MKKIEVKILNPESIDQAEKLMVCAARLTQRGHQISCLDDFMDLYEKPYQRSTVANLVKLPHPTIQKFGIINVVVVGASRRFLAQITRHQNEVKYMSASLQYSDYSGVEDFVIPYDLMGTGQEEGYLRQCSMAMKNYQETDGYQGYNNLPDIKRCSCWAHVRRYFTDAIPKGKEYDYSLPAVQGVQFCSKLFDCERYSKAKNHTAEQRKQFRLEKEKPILEAFWNWLDQQRPNKGTRLAKAVNYAQNRKGTLMTYLEDGHCSLSNNLSENAIRPFTVGRKNWLFSASPKGAASSAIVYTMVEMAKANDLNTYKYLTYLLSQRPDDKMSDEQLEQLAPWSETAKTNCQT